MTNLQNCLGILLLGILPVFAQYQSAGFLQLPGDIQLDSVSAVEVAPDGRIYVLHRGNPPLLQFDAKGHYVQGWATGKFKVAHGLRTDRDGNIWTTDNALHVIHKFSPQGELLLTLGEEGVAGSDETHFRSPDDLVFSKSGDIYLADAGNGRIVRLDSKGKWKGAWGKRGSNGRLHGSGEFAAAHGLAIDGQDRIYVADRGNDRVQVFDREGNFLRFLSGFGNPFGLLVVGKDLLVSDGDAHTISHIGLDTGGMTAQWGDPSLLKLPHLMAVAPHGKLYVAEVQGQRVQIFREVSGRH